MSDRQGIVIVGETTEGNLAQITLELLGAGRTVADTLGQQLIAVFLGGNTASAALQASSCGADRTYVIEDTLLDDGLVEPQVSALQRFDEHVRPEVILFGHTSLGRDVAPRLAFRLNTGLTLDCVALSVDKDTGLLRKVKPVYGGNAVATYVCEGSRPQMAAIRPKAMTAAERDESRTGKVETFHPELDASAVRSRVLGREMEETKGIKLEDASIIVCGGRGLGGPEGFEMLSEIAEVLGAAVGATRPPCDTKWCPAGYQIGLTGKLVSPELYIGVALSGSSQHQAGMAGAKTIVAINKDEEANIFSVAHFGVVGEYQKVLPSFLAKCRELTSG